MTDTESTTSQGDSAPGRRCKAVTATRSLGVQAKGQASPARSCQLSGPPIPIPVTTPKAAHEHGALVNLCIS